MRQSDGQLLTLDLDGNTVLKPGLKTGDFKFPLVIGAHWTLERKTLNGRGNVQTSWRVVAFEKVTVPAGTFECMKVEAASYWTRDPIGAHFKGAWQAGSGTRQYWYSADVRWFVKSVQEQQSTIGTPWIKTETVLTAFEPGK